MTTRQSVGVTGTGLLVLAAYMSTILTANWASAVWPALSVAGLWVPAGALCAGFVFSLRDLVHTMLGTRGVLAAIVIGIGLSWLVASPQIALASAVAFAASEVADWRFSSLSGTVSLLHPDASLVVARWAFRSGC
jgi:uncharacterized PurR-regulated membrane protein YhhQ (DUF165 family)